MQERDDVVLEPKFVVLVQVVKNESLFYSPNDDVFHEHSQGGK
jgi:hypothetical protein